MVLEILLLSVYYAAWVVRNH